MTGEPGTRGFDPLAVEVHQHLFAAVAEEMGVALQRSAFSANIKERLTEAELRKIPGTAEPSVFEDIFEDEDDW